MNTSNKDKLPSICGYCGSILGKDNYPKFQHQSITIELPESYEIVEGSCCITKERLGYF